VILSAVYMLWMVRRVFFGPVTLEANLRLEDLSLREKVVAVALVVPMFWIGIYPASFLRPMDRSVEDLLRTMVKRGAQVELVELPELPRRSEPPERALAAASRRDKGAGE
jgi:NADH-quinone oxidoreductase subunit M